MSRRKSEPGGSSLLSSLPTTQVGSTIMPMSPDGLFPAVGMHSLGEEVRLHLNAELGREDDSVMMVDSYEDEWGRLHDVRVCGTVSKGWCAEGAGEALGAPALRLLGLLRIGSEDSVFCRVLESENLGRSAWHPDTILEFRSVFS